MKIIVKHSCIMIYGYKMGMSPKIEKYFSIYDKVSFKYYFKGLEYDEENEILYLPRGIDIWMIENEFNIKAIVDKNCDKYTIHDDIKLKYMPRDDNQKQALKFMIGKEEYHANTYKSQLSLNLNTGVGKSYVSIATIAYTGITSAIITSSIGWLDQWKDYITEYTNIKSNEIYLISGIGTIHTILKKNISKYKIYLMSHMTIKSYGDKYGWDKVGELFRYLNIGMKFYDEAHLNYDNIMSIDFHTNAYKTYYVSATPARSDRSEDFIYKLSFKNVPSIDLFDAEKDPHTKYIAIKYSSHPSAQIISQCRNRYGLDRNKYIDYVVRQPNFYIMLRYLIDLIMKHEGKALIYIGTNNAIKIVRDWIITEYPELYNNVGIYTSIITSNKEQQLEKKIILSTTKSCGAAMDISNLKMTILLAEPFSSQVIARQTLGRTRNDNTYYIEIVDIGFKTITNFYSKKLGIFKKYALSTVETTMNDKYLNNVYANIMNKRRFIYTGPVMPAIQFYKELPPAIEFNKNNKAIEFI